MYSALQLPEYIIYLIQFSRCPDGLHVRKQKQRDLSD